MILALLIIETTSALRLPCKRSDGSLLVEAPIILFLEIPTRTLLVILANLANQLLIKFIREV